MISYNQIKARCVFGFIILLLCLLVARWVWAEGYKFRIPAEGFFYPEEQPYLEYKLEDGSLIQIYTEMQPIVGDSKECPEPQEEKPCRWEIKGVEVGENGRVLVEGELNTSGASDSPIPFIRQVTVNEYLYNNPSWMPFSITTVDRVILWLRRCIKDKE